MDKIQFQGIPLPNIAEEFGTPLYVYDAAKIESQVNLLKSAFSDQDLRIKYAAKALTNINILRLMKKFGVGMDAVSIEEAKLGIKAGFEPGEILYTPNSVSFAEIQAGVALGLVINIDNIAILEQFGKQYGDQVPCCIRLNPHIMAGGNRKISTGHADSKFGISIFQLPQLVKVANHYDIKVVGLHIHTGSDILESEVFLRMADILFGVAGEFPMLKFLDFGSGFKVGYKEGDVATNVFDMGIKLGKAFSGFCARYGRKLELWFEPGKFLVSEAGVLLSKVNVVKHTPGSVFAGIDTGLNHLLRPMMYDAYHEIINITNPTGDHHFYTVVGNICETDTFGTDRKINEIRTGDVLAIKNAGAYGFSMASNYNSRLKPAEVLVYQGKPLLIRKRESFDDLLRNQVDVNI